jgi:Imelysin
MYRLSFAALACLAAFLVGCGGDDQPETTPKPSPAAAQAADLQPIKDYLLDHTERLVRSTEQLQRDAQEYYDLAKASNFDYAKMLADNREAVATSMKELQADFVQANPDYEQMEGVVAGVPSLADYDVIIDAGSDKSDPENAVPFSIKTENGRTFEQPGNFFFLLESSIYGTEPKFVAKDVKADLDGDGNVAFPEALPDAKFLVAATTDFAKNAKDLDESAKKWDPTLEDAFTAMVVMTPTMSEYFDSWKASRFIQGNKSGEKSFVATSRLSDISDILSGLVLIYESIQPAVETVNKEQAGQTKVSLEQLHQFSQRLFNEEQGGKTFTPDDADTLGSEAQRRAEAIAGQISQAAGQLNLKLED